MEVIAGFLPPRSIPAQFPKLKIDKSTKEARWDADSCGRQLVAELKQSLNALRAEPTHGLSPIDADSYVKRVIDELSDGLLDDPDAFCQVAQRLGVPVRAVRETRSNSHAGAGLGGGGGSGGSDGGGSSSSTDQPPPEPIPEPMQTRGAEQAEQRTLALAQLAGFVNTLAPEAAQQLGRMLSREAAAVVVAGHVAEAGAEHLEAALSPAQRAAAASRALADPAVAAAMPAARR